MSTTVRAATVLGPDDARVAARLLQRDPAEWLPGDARRSGAGWLLLVRAGRATRAVRAHIGGVVISDGRIGRRLRWVPLRPDASHRDTVLPAFDGRVQLLPDGDEGESLLVVTGAYEPPGGAAGRGVDALVMHHVARHTLNRLLEELVPGLTNASRTAA
ncbi:hypothetical protein [Euzebya rosea]|uniref:hypothetical protein n=1 Tax=Euzebya rosea TaxID=2052804 RepID=UPI000D3E4200|nr:hypothetical protein [Euzebya rosea]